MHSKTVFLLICLSALFASFAGAQPAPVAVKPVAVTRPTEVIPARGILYRVRHQGNTSYLFGTIHVGKPGFYPLEAQVMKAFNESGKLVVEFDVRNSTEVMAAVTKYGMYGANDSIENHLSKDSLAQLQITLGKIGIPLTQMASMKPWMLANLLLLLDMEKSGFSATQGTDLFLLALADKAAKPVEQLETADYQLSLFDRMPASQQEEYLRDNLTELANGKALKKLTELATAWGKADSRAFDAILREAVAENTASSRFLLATLLDKRNLEMTAKVEGFLKRDKSSFVAVGLLHLVGEKGLPSLLQKRGYEVEKVY
jgi:uncharacterized protein YbaP (TraB family)